MAARVAPAAVEAREWGWRYASRRAWAARAVSVAVAPGERVLLLGASGAGKSTLLQGIAGVLGGADEGEHEGRLLVDGAPAADVRGRAGLVLQDPDSQTILARVGDDVAFGCENLGVARAEIWPRVREALDAVGLDVPLDHPTAALSGGQKQRLALAGALAMRPGVLLLDEPTANLDPAGVAEVRDAVARVLEATSATLVVIEHRVEVWLGLVDRVIVLGAVGGVLADGSPEEVLGPGGARASAASSTAAAVLGAGATDAAGPTLARRLADAGVWVPGIPPALPPPPAALPGETLLAAERLVVARTPGVPVAGPIDVAVRAGEVLGIVGANGAGKSTLGLTLAGLLAAESGAVIAAPGLAAGATARRGRRSRRERGAHAGTDPFAWTSAALLDRVGMLLQEPEHQLLTSTVRDELEVGPRALGLAASEIRARVDELLERLRLAHLAAANPYTLSGGEKRRLTVAATLATRPRVIVLDEPTFGQDARTWAELVAIIAGLRDGVEGERIALAAITHDEAVLEALNARRFEVGR